MIVRAREYILNEDGAPNGKTLLNSLYEFQAGLHRLQTLEAAYNNEHAICARVRDKKLPNNRMAHGYARYITTMASGYLIGEPITYTGADDAQTEQLAPILEAYRHTDIDSVDGEIATAASVYGRGVEIVFSDADAEPRSASLDPKTAFVVYDDTVMSVPALGVHITRTYDANHVPSGYAVTAYTDAAAYLYRVQDLGLLETAAPDSVTPHYFGGVPLIEYWNNAEETGDFEQVLSEIDAYDSLQSDRVNDKQQFVDTLLVILGATLSTDEQGRTPMQQLAEDRSLFLPDGSSAQYLSKSLDEAGVEILRQSIASDIHKFSLVPDMTDKEFAGNVSGEAMKYKLLGLEQLTRKKEEQFRLALKERLKMYAYFLGMRNGRALDISCVTITFARSLPVNDLALSQTARNLKGIIPDQSILAMLPFVQDVDAAMAQLDAQRQQDIDAQRRAFGGYADITGESGNADAG